MMENSMELSQTDRRRPFSHFVLLFAIIALLAQCLLLYGHTGRDDAFFTYWPAVTLAEQGDILNYSGEHIEQSSTLLHTLCLALLHVLLPAVSLSALAWAVSLTAAVSTLAVYSKLLQVQQHRNLALITLAFAPSLVFWASSGMETLSTTLLFTLLLYLLIVNHPRLWLLTGIATLTVISRPETFAVLLAFTALGWLTQAILFSNTSHRRWLTLLVATLVSFTVVTVWRLYYFGDIFPQPVSAKHWPDRTANLLRGFNYLLKGGQSPTTQLITTAGLLAWIAACCWRNHPHRRGIVIAGSLALAQIAFILGTGGDWMDATRFLLPVLPALWLCSALFTAQWRRLHIIFIIGTTMLAAWDSWQFASKKSTGLAFHERAAVQQQYLPDSLQERYSLTELQTKDALRDIPQLEHLRHLVQTMQIPGRKIAIASIQMGFIPYHLSREFFPNLHFLDLRALSTRELTRCELTKQIYRHDMGVKISYDQFFALLPQLTERCGIVKPDIIYDLGYDMRKDVLAKNGYITTYRERRGILGQFSQRGIGSELFVAVRRELAEQFALTDAEGNTITSPGKPAPPNIVLLLADDISYDHFGFMGNRAARTPTLDQLAAQGTVFSTGYVPTAFCRPSLATLLTGQWPHQTRLHANNGVVALPATVASLPVLLKQQGYATFAGGKFWEDDPLQHGFDEADIRKEQFARENQDALWQFIDKHGGQKPLFVWWAPMLPHTPHNPPQALIDAVDRDSIEVPDTIATDQRDEYRDKTRNLLAMNLWMDAEIGKLQKKLAEKGLLDNTLIVFLSDNGFSHRDISKSSPYELGLRTPIIFHWPGHVPTQRIDTPTETLNLFNTLLDFAGAAQPAPSHQQPGHSLRAVIEQKETLQNATIIGADYRAITKKIGPDPRPERDIFALHVRDGDWKYIFYLDELRIEDNANLTIKQGMAPFPTRNPGDEELYRLDTDPYEQHNLATQPDQQQRMIDLRRQALQWWHSTGGLAFDVTQSCPEKPALLCRKILDKENPKEQAQNTQ